MPTELLEAPGVAKTPATFNTKPIVYGIAEKRIAELASMYLKLKVESVDDKAGLTVVHDARLTIKQHRVDIEKTRKALKEDALRYGQTVDAEAKRLTALLEPIEAHLQAEEDRIAAEKRRIKEEADAKRHEAVLDRMNKLLAVNCTSLNYVQCQDMAEEVFGQKLAEATEAHRVKQEEARKAKLYAEQIAEEERQRLEAERAEQDRLRAEEDARRKAEAEQLAKERAELERQKAEEARQRQEAEKRAAKERAELERQRREQQAEADRLADERRKLEEEQAAKRRVEEEAKAKAEELERSRVAAEELAKRQAAEEKKRREQAAADLAIDTERFLVAAPDDVADAFEQFRLTIMRHRAERWSAISKEDMRYGVGLLLTMIATNDE